MSDYAGVIGNVVTIVGAATGQVWLQAAGMALSAWGASQQVLPGPKIGDVQRQTSQEGGFRPIVYGRSHPISGNIIADGGPVIVTRRERQGKGGPKVESESAYRTYAVGVCEGEATLLQAWRNGILVYDAEDGSMAAENAAFLEYATWYTGSFDQPASPDLEEVYGAGQAPYFRGTAYLSIHNEDVTDQRGAWSQWQFRVFRGAAKSYITPPYPFYVVDEIATGGISKDGAWWTPPVDHTSVEFFAADGSRRLLLVEYENYAPEPLDVTFRADDGSRRMLVAEYENYAPEPLDVTFRADDGTRRVYILTYQNYEPEPLDVSFTALDGARSLL